MFLNVGDSDQSKLGNSQILLWRASKPKFEVGSSKLLSFAKKPEPKKVSIGRLHLKLIFEVIIIVEILRQTGKEKLSLDNNSCNNSFNEFG